MKRIRAVAVLPTMFTLGNLLCGFFAIAVAARIEKPPSAAIPVASKVEFTRVNDFINTMDPVHAALLCGCLIFLAMIFDALDGSIARMTRHTTEFGAELDSLSDLVTFGLAPAFLLVKICPTFTYLHREAVWIIAATFAVCAALRLARFNVETSEEDDHSYFSGLPTPAAAAAIASFPLLFYTLRQVPADADMQGVFQLADSWIQVLLPVFAVLLALAMVSRVPYPHVVYQLLWGQRSFAHLIGIVFAVLAMLIVRGFAIPLIVCAYVLVPPVIYAWQRVFRRRAEEETLF